MNQVLERLQGGLISSCQPVDDGPMDRPGIVAAMAKAAVEGGAAGLRIEGVDNLRATRAVVDVPIIGIVKSDSTDTPVRITVSTDDVEQLVAAGASIVAYDATDRPRTNDRDEILGTILSNNVLAMADCATLSDGERALSNGAAILGSTLSGYTKETDQHGDAPDLALVRDLKKLGCFVMAEGRYDTPELSAEAIRAGADAVTVGSSLTRLEIMTDRFARAISAAGREKRLTGFSVDFGGTKTAVARFEAGQIVNRVQRPTQGDAAPADQIQRIADLLKEVGFQHGARLGVAVTGRVDQKGNWYAVNKDTLNQIDAVPLAQMLTDRIGPAAVINDAAAATLAEHRLGSGQGHESFAFITVSTGIGGGLIVNNHLLLSSNGMAGHIGFTSAPGAQSICGSGRFGTVESLAGGRAIARAALEAGHGNLDARAVFEEAISGATWAEKLILDSAKAVSELAADLVAMLGVTRIAIGGSIGRADGYLERVRSYNNSLPALFGVDLVSTELGANGPLWGALLVAEKNA